MGSRASIEEGVEKDRIDTSDAGTSESVAGVVDEDAKGIEAMATLMRSNNGGRGVYTK